MKTYLKDLTPEEITQRLKNGEVVKMEHSASYIKMIDGIMVRFYPLHKPYINAPINLDNDDFYFETEEPLTFEEGKFYKTRDGRKVFVSCIINGDFPLVRGVIQGEECITSWYLSGEYEQCFKNDVDIISKWED